VSHGFGTLTMLGFNPERESFRSWRHAPWFWARIINAPGGWFVEQKKHHYGGVSADGVFGVLLDTDQVQKLPVSSLLCLLIFYLFLIGPLDRLWLKRINRTMLTWITFPLYVLGFSLLIYWIGFALRSGILEWNELHVVDVLPSGQEAMLRGRSYASFYSPYSRNYTLHSTTPASSVRTEFMGRDSGGVDPFRAVIQQRNDGYDAKLSMAVWTSEMLVEEWHLKGKPPLRVSGDWRIKDVPLALQNQAGRTLKEVNLVIQGRIYTVGEIKAGETRDIQLAKLGSSTIQDYVRNQGGQIYERAQQRTYAFGNNAPKAPANPAQIAIIGSFLSQIEAKADNYSSGRFFISPQGLDLSSLAAREGLLVFAWDEGTSPVKSAAGFEIPRRKQDTLWRMVLARPTP
ncbi:MAG TPA: hypothetical protein VK968_10695, partial [Roseimicrobium sp.]|nr:hypothetical protein [Roseimicrobium sp.]